MDRQMYMQKLETLKQIQRDDHHALRIAMCGKFKSGKSSLLNLMLGTDLPVKATTATGIVTKIIYGRASAVKMRSGEIKKISKQELYDYISVVEKNLDGVILNDARSAYIGSRSRLLKHGKVEFWDTPGLEDDPELTQIAMDAIHQCDFLIYVMHAAQVLSQYEKRLFPKLDKLMNGNIIFVVNHMDSLRDDERDAVIRSVTHMLEGYQNNVFPGGRLFFTSANPDHPEISPLLDGISQMCGQKENRINILNHTKNGKSSVLEEEWKDDIHEDMEEAKQNIQNYQQLIKEDIERKKAELDKCHTHCIDCCQRAQKELEAAIRNESAWRMVLTDYQNISGWETDFVNESEKRIKGRMTELIKKGNEEIRDAVEGSIFKSDRAVLRLDERLVWKKANWYKNFSRPLFFPERRFRQFSRDCVETCIGALMANPVVIAGNQVSTFFTSFFSSINDHFRTAMAEIKGAPDLLRGLENANSDKMFIEDHQSSIAAIQRDIREATLRNRFFYKIKDFFSFFFKSLLSDERYG